MVVTVKALDHIVLTVRDISATVDFYTKHLGMKHERFVSPKDTSVERSVLLFELSRHVDMLDWICLVEQPSCHARQG